MTLAKLLEGVRVTKMFAMQYGKHVLTHDVNIRTVQYDSRKVERGDLFVAIRGTAADGHAFVQQAVERGAVAVIVEKDEAVHDFYFLHARVLKIVVPDSRKALAQCASNYYGRPSAGLRLVGVTGTNGKTTTTHIIKSVLEAGGETVGLVGTIRYLAGSEEIPATHTTPESLELQQLFDDNAPAGMHVGGHGGLLPRPGDEQGVREPVRRRGLHEPDAGPPGLPRVDGSVLRREEDPV